MKNPNYTATGGRDLIDQWRDNHPPEIFRAILIAQIEKYCSRYGKKDETLREIGKIIDYAKRLQDFEIDNADKS